MKLFRRTAIAAAATLALVPPALVPAAHAQKSADTLRIEFAEAVANVDPYFNSQRTGLILAHHVWDTLVYRDPGTFGIKAALATVPGVTDLSVFESLGQPTVRIDVDRHKAAR